MVSVDDRTPARAQDPPTGGMLAVDLDRALPALTAERVAAAPGGAVTVIARLHAHPVGQIELTPPLAGLSPAEFAVALEPLLPAAGDHLRGDGLACPARIDPAGFGKDAPCLARRRAVLAQAPLVTVLIATRDRTESLLRCLASVAELDHPRFEVVVVDSAPTTDTTRRAVMALRGRLGPAVLRYVHEPHPGLALAHNRGVEHAEGAWVAITDDDVVVDRQWLAALSEAAAQPGVGCVTGLILPAELTTRAQVLLEQYGGFSRGFTPRLFDTGRHRPDDPLFPFAAGRLGSGANMAFRVDALRGFGGFDVATGAGTPARGGDDLSAFLRLLQGGHTVAYQPSAIVWHHHRREYAGLRRQARNYGIGLGAYLAAAVVEQPRLAAVMLRRTVPALQHLLSRSSPKNARKRTGFPRELERAERLGVLLGPVAYAVSRLRRHRVR